METVSAVTTHDVSSTATSSSQCVNVSLVTVVTVSTASQSVSDINV